MKIPGKINMIFKVKIFSGSFICYIKGTGNVKIIVNDKFIKSLSLPNSINIRSKEYYNDSDIYKIQIKDIDSKDVIIGPVIEGYITEIESWGDLNIIYLYKLFENNDNEILKLPNYIPKSLTDLSYLFFGARSRHIEGIDSWDVSSVTDMRFMFTGAKNFNQDISSWDVSSVKIMNCMFEGTEKFNGDISKWYTSPVKDMSSMFFGAKRFNQDISSWDVSSVKNMSHMFYEAENFDQDISSWNVSSVIDMSYMFSGAKSF